MSLCRSPSSPRPLRQRLMALALALTLPALTTCARAPATGDPIFTGGMTMEKEREIGAEQHPKLVKAFGGEYEDPQMRGYVDELGETLAAQSELPNLDWTFTLLDTPVVNAFALPGGYVYVTRGLVSLANNEAELAGVIGHEIGHVTARHSAERYGGSILANVAGLASAIFLGGEAARATSSLGQVALASYSRSQEFQADSLGVRYLARTDYEAEAMATFLDSLQANTELQATLRGNPDAADQFNIMQTHPRTPERVRAAIDDAAQTLDGTITAREPFLDQIAGLRYGYSPEEGFVRGRRFLHPTLRFAFEVPEGFTLFNAATQVTAFGPEGAVIVFDRAQKPGSADPLTYLQRDWAANARLQEVERVSVNGLEAATGRTQGRIRQGRRDFRLVAIRYDDDTIYRFMFVTKPGSTARFNVPFRETTHSFRALDESEAQALKPLTLRIHTVQQGESVDSLARQMPFDDHQVLRFRTLNGLKEGDSLTPGQTVKLVE
mgnify:CR=1 FL=1